MDRRVGEPYEDADSDYYGEAPKKKVDDLVWGNSVSIVEGDAVCDKPTEYLG